MNQTKTPSTKTVNYQPRLKLLYYNELRPQLHKDLKLANIYEVPKLEKIVINTGLGRSKDNKQIFATAENTLAKISGQKPQICLSRMSIASFKLRTGNKIGMMVTLRDQRMYEFLDRLINLVIPRFRDFRGISLKAFDTTGNYSIGFREQALFPELSFEETNPAHGLQANLVFDSNNAQYNKALMEAFGFKFEKEKS